MSGKGDVRDRGGQAVWSLGRREVREREVMEREVREMGGQGDGRSGRG